MKKTIGKNKRFTIEEIIEESKKWQRIFDKALEKLKEEYTEKHLLQELHKIDMKKIDYNYIEELQRRYNRKEYNTLVNSYIITSKWYRQI